MALPSTNRARWPHPILLVLLAVTVVYGSVATWRRLNRPPGRWVGYTNCAWRGKSRVVVRSGLRSIDSLAVAAHESVHAAECEELGPIRYRWRTLFASSNLALETPAYCAGARVRARLNGDTAFLRMTIPIDMIAAMGDVIDSATIVRSIAKSCPEFVQRK
jgi:hypothetical protein